MNTLQSLGYALKCDLGECNYKKQEAEDRQLPDQYKSFSLVRWNSFKNIMFELFIEIFVSPFISWGKACSKILLKEEPGNILFSSSHQDDRSGSSQLKGTQNH